MEEKIGFRVKQARLNAGLTQEELAEKANMSSSFISRLENGKILPSIKKLLMLADIMNVGLEDLLRDFFSSYGRAFRCTYRTNLLSSGYDDCS